MVTPRRSARSRAKVSPEKPISTTSKHFTKNGKGNASKKLATGKSRKLQKTEDEEYVSPSPSPESDAEESDAYQDEDEQSESDVASLHSDALDDDDFGPPSKTKKRKRASGASTSTPKRSKNARKSDVNGKESAKKSPSKKRKAKDESESEVDGGASDGDEDTYVDGMKVIGKIAEAPKTGRVPPGQISQNTFNFLSQLTKPKCNDRTWFKLHEPVYRLAEKEWKDFIEEFTPFIAEADPHIPPLPPNDVVHRIYRDIRFSNDKTPYKTNFSASFSRSGRKGIFAGYHISIKPGGGSFFAAGTWCPGKNEIQTIRSHILRNSGPLRAAISAPEFVKLYGEAKPHPKGQKRNIFGSEDELKTAPKGITRDHDDIDLLKCRSFAVMHKFTDKEVLSPDFREELKEIVESTRPFVHLLNNMMTVQVLEGEEEPDEE